MQILLKLAEILTFTNQVYFRRIYVESSQYNNACISLSICNDKLIFDKEAFLSFVSVDMPTYPILWFHNFSCCDVITSFLY